MIIRNVVVITLCFVLLFLNACVEKRDLSENTVIVHIASEPDGLSPTNDNSANRSFIFQYTQMTASKMDLPTLDKISNLCEYPPEVSEDKLEYTWTIKQGAKWDDGSPLTRDDFIYTVKMILCPLTDNAALRPVYDNAIKEIKPHPTEENKFILVAEEVRFDNKDLLTEVYVQQKSHWDPKGITDKYSFEDFEKENFNPDEDFQDFMNFYNNSDNSYKPENLVGLGPYQVTEWEVGNYIAIERKENWWGAEDTSIYKQQYPEKIIFKIIIDDATSYMAIKNQNIDVSTRLGTNKLLKLQKLNYFNENYHSGFLDQYSYSYIGLNNRPDGINNKPFFVDPKVRRAMAHLTPVDDIMQVLAYGKANRQAAQVSSLKKWYNNNLELINFDIEKAKKLLDEAGWKDTDGDNIRDKVIEGEKLQFSFKLNYVGGSLTSKQLVLMIKEQMYKAGIDLQPNPMDFSLLFSKAQDHEFDAMLAGWGGSAAESDPYQLWHTQSWVTKGSNFCGFGDAESDALIEEWGRTVDDSIRYELSKKLQKKIYDEQPYIFMYSTKRKIIIHKRFDNAGMYNERPGVIVNNLKLNSKYLKNQE